MEHCKLCGSKVSLEKNSRVWYNIECPRCGFYMITDQAFCCNWGMSEEDKVLFSGYIRNFSTKDNPVKITIHTLSAIKDIIAPFKHLSVIDKVNKLIYYIGDRAKSLNDRVWYNYEHDFVIFYGKNPEEFSSIYNYLKSKNIIYGPESYTKDGLRIGLTIDGWKEYEKLKEKNINSKKVFVAMSFDKTLDDIYYEAIQPACQECGFHTERVDLIEHNEKICDRIIAEIKEARFLIADFTQQKHNVYFEAGFAQGLGLKVIWSCKRGEENKLQFDTRQYNHIIWNDVEDLKKQLINRIKATIK